ncbi:HAD hydrolase-like protein [Microbacterium esteraromaticum]|uniref:HAD family hydrolase n=1 Tax=Microbacterium esteraromaticum TaxID=57043 RepID=UPI001CD23F99|nr:HAD family hydrolase [Microbacterium esteraromaticum]MCA1306501.1 HAD hydrolase-like protein [Microbacterium esteraromaticum]
MLAAQRADAAAVGQDASARAVHVAADEELRRGSVPDLDENESAPAVHRDVLAFGYLDAMTSEKRRARLLVVDLDDTIWTWFDAWHSSFSELLRVTSELSGISTTELKRAIRPIHQRHGTSEYSWLLDELDQLGDLVPAGTTVAEYFDPALHAQNHARKVTTQLYPGVRETLTYLRDNGTTVVAYTESLAFWTRWRIQQTSLDGLISELYSSPDHDTPDGVDLESRRTLPSEEYELHSTEHRHVPAGIVKPNPSILQQILDDHAVPASEAVYVGDSVMKDVAMAQRVGAIDVLAAYGVKTNDPRYRLLQDVSHWPDSTVAKEQDKSPGVHPTPTLVLSRGLSDILDYVAFGRTVA